ncbi:MAG: hypothetical protein AAB263_15565 [Planctomycetota bacterium]
MGGVSIDLYFVTHEDTVIPLRLEYLMPCLPIVACWFVLSACLIAGETPPPPPAPVPVAFLPSLTLSADERTILERFVGHATTYAAGLTQEKVRAQCAQSPEMFAWIEFPSLAGLLDAYALTNDVRYLDTFRDRMSLFLDIMEPGDDGFLGWWGRTLKDRQLADKPDLRIDELQMNFRAIAVLSRWIDLARQHPDYAAANAAVIAKYLASMEEHLFPKWDKRGFFVDLGLVGGTYRGLDYPLVHTNRTGVTLSHEKSSIVVDGLLQLYRVTGKSLYLRRAIQLGIKFKHCLSLIDDHYEWMSWEPGGRWDAHPTKEDAWAVGWIAPDPNGGWYEASVSIAVSLYQHGLVFDDTDLARLIATQKKRCWNGDLVTPVYRTVAGVSGAENKFVKGRFLSLALSLYDPVLSQLAFAGPHEADLLTGSTNSWKGLIAIESYVRAKYFMRPLLANGPRPYAKVGEQFLADPDNRAFYDKLQFTVVAPGCITPLKPSQMTH